MQQRNKVCFEFELIVREWNTTAVCIMIDRSQKLVEWDFSFPMTGFYGFDKGVNDDE